MLVRLLASSGLRSQHLRCHLLLVPVQRLHNLQQKLRRKVSLRWSISSNSKGVTSFLRQAEGRVVIFVMAILYWTPVKMSY